MFLRAALAAIVLNQISHHAGAFHLPFQLRHNTYKARVYDSPLVNSISRGGCDTTGTTTKSSNTNTLFPSPRFQEDRSSKQFAVLSTGDEPTSSNKPLLRRLYENSIGRLWKACLLLFKVLLMKPLSMLKSMVTSPKEKSDTDTKEVTKIETTQNGIQIETNNAQKPITIVEPMAKDVYSDNVSASQKYGEVTNQGQIGTTIGQLVVEKPPVLIEEEQMVVEPKTITEVPYFLEEVEPAHHTGTSNHVISHGDGSVSSTIASHTTHTHVTTHKGEGVVTSSEVGGRKALPKGERWAIAAPGVDFTAKWKIIVDAEFKVKYDAYLKGLGQPSLVRSVAVSIVEMTIEEIIQEDEGRALCIKGKNLRGLWERTLIASGSDYEDHHEDGKDHLQVPIVTADKEKVQGEAWWEDDGKTHFSILKGVKKYGGGDFESKRYLESDGNVLVCESAFIPNGKGKERASITWKFKRT